MCFPAARRPSERSTRAAIRRTEPAENGTATRRATSDSMPDDCNDRVLDAYEFVFRTLPLFVFAFVAVVGATRRKLRYIMRNVDLKLIFVSESVL